LVVVGGRQEVARLRVQKGAEVKEGWTPLRCAARHGDEAIVALFLNEADAHSRDTDGSPARAVAETEDRR